MSDLQATLKPKRVEIEAVIIRADGTREDLGKIADSKWRRFDPRRSRANRRIQEVNERHGS